MKSDQICDFLHMLNPVFTCSFHISHSCYSFSSLSRTLSVLPHILNVTRKYSLYFRKHLERMYIMNTMNGCRGNVNCRGNRGCSCDMGNCDQMPNSCSCGSMPDNQNTCGMSQSEIANQCQNDSAGDCCTDPLYGMPLAMGYVPWQQWNKIYDPCDGLANGTIFPELNLQFYGCIPQGCGKGGRL